MFCAVLIYQLLLNDGCVEAEFTSILYSLFFQGVGRWGVRLLTLAHS